MPAAGDRYLAAEFSLLVNLFPMFPAHSLLAAKQLTPQVLTANSLRYRPAPWA